MLIKIRRCTFDLEVISSIIIVLRNSFSGFHNYASKNIKMFNEIKHKDVIKCLRREKLIRTICCFL